MNPTFTRRRFITATSFAMVASWLLERVADGREVRVPQLLIVSALGPDHPLMLSFVSQLLEQGIWFEFDQNHALPAELSEDFERHHALVLDMPAVEAMLKDATLRTRLDAFAKKGGFVFRLEAAVESEPKSNLDLTTKHRVADIVAHVNLTQRHPGLRVLQLARPVGRMMDELKKSLVGKLAAKGWSEYRLHEWKATIAMIENGHAEMREPLADSIRRACGNLPPPVHHDVIAGWFGAAWLAEAFEEREPLNRVVAQLDEMLERRPRTMGVVSGYGFTDDPLGLAEGGRSKDALAHGTMRRDTIWTEMLHMHSATFASIARVTGQARYRDEMVRLIEHIHRHHLRPDGLLAHSTREGKPIAAAWSRAQTHALYGLIYTLQELPADDLARPKIIELLDAVGRGLLPYQDAATGLWRNVIDHPDSRMESSGTTGIVFAYARAVREGWLPRERYEPMLRKAWDGLRCLYWRGGLAANCRGSGVSVDVSYYLGRPQGWAWMPQLIPASLDLQKLGIAQFE